MYRLKSVCVECTDCGGRLELSGSLMEATCSCGHLYKVESIEHDLGLMREERLRINIRMKGGSNEEDRNNNHQW